jgi:hypothetical protein
MEGDHDGARTMSESDTICLDEERVLSFLSGSLEVELLGEVEHHLDSCAHCYRLVAAVAPTLVSRSTQPADWAFATVRPGQVLAGRYYVVRLLGVGACGLVVRADDRITEGRVAL